MLDNQNTSFEADDVMSSDHDLDVLTPNEDAARPFNIFDDLEIEEDEEYIDDDEVAASTTTADTAKIDDIPETEESLDDDFDEGIETEDNDEPVDAETIAVNADAPPAEAQASAEMTFASLLDGVTYPDTFTVTPQGVIAEITDKKGKATQTHICGPLVVTAKLDHVTLGRKGKEIAFIDRDDCLRTAVVWDSELHASSASLAAALADKGLWLDTRSRSRAEVVRYLNESEPTASKRYVDTAGWIGDDTFVLGSRTIGRSDIVIAENPVLEGASTIGTMEEWTQLIGAKCTGNPLLLFAVSFALSGPTYRMVDLAAFGVHLFGDSSLGKTTHARVAASVFGPGRTDRGGFMQSWRATNNGLEFAFPARNDTLFVLDEIGEATPADVEVVAYMAANGRGKMRSTPSGGVRPVAKWRVPILSTGEMSVSGHVLRGGGRIRAGQDIRLLSVPLCSATRDNDPFRNLHGSRNAAEFARALESAAINHAGHIGVAFIKRLCASHSECTERLKSIRDSFENRFIEDHLGGLDNRVLRVFGTIAAAGVLASEFELLPQSQKEIFDAVAEVFNRWRAHAAGNIGAANNVIHDLNYAIETHGKTRFVWDKEKTKFVSTSDIWGVWEDDRQFIWLRSSAFAKHILNGHDCRAAYASLINAGVAIPHASGSPTWLKRFSDHFNLPQVRFLKIDVNALCAAVAGNEVADIEPDTDEERPRRSFADVARLRR